jgi:zinc transporter ZupT
MVLSLITFTVTTVIALVSVRFASGARVRYVLPWTAGVLLGVSVFWILPEIAEDRGWTVTLALVVPLVLVLALIDRYVYPICPFCLGNLHAQEQTCHSHAFTRRAVAIGWPLLIVGCVHCFLDGWAIGLARVGAAASSAAAAISYGVIVHKLPESVAIGIVAARLTSTRLHAMAMVGLIQLSMLAGGVFSFVSAYRDIASLELFSIPACAFLILFGFLALEDEWRLNGIRRAILAAVPGVVGCGLMTLATKVFAR